jgi:uncharacterized protein DUF3592
MTAGQVNGQWYAMNISPIHLYWLYLRGPFLWMGLIIAFLGTALIALGYGIWRWEHEFQSYAVRAIAKVTGKETGTVKTGSHSSEPAYFLVYTFLDETSKQYQGKVGAPLNDWKRAKRGDTLEIEYDRTAPATSRRAGTEAHAGWGFLICGGIGGLFAFIGTLFFSVALVAAWRRTRLVRSGSPALGVVGEVVENESAFRVVGTYRLTYQFTDSDGTTWDGQGPPQPWSLAARWNPGETILVLYDPKKPGRNEPDIWESRNQDLERLQEDPANQ